AWVYAARGHNFLRTMLRLAHERDSVGIVDDQRGAPTTARLIANATAQALGRWQAYRKHDDRQHLSGVYHLCATGECTWYEFARRIFIEALAAGLIERPMQLTPIATADYPTKARRPAYSVLDTQKIRATFGLDLSPWQRGLDATIDELKTGLNDGASTVAA
ncbi:MAG: sugar nucleotide-binding protein, partial [Rudaea sp.]